MPYIVRMMSLRKRRWRPSRIGQWIRRRLPFHLCEGELLDDQQGHDDAVAQVDALPDGRCRFHEVLLARDGEYEHAGALVFLVDRVPEVAKPRMRSEVRGEAEIALGHGLHRVLNQGAEERVAAVQAGRFFEPAFAVERLQGRAEAKVSRHVLLQLRPRTDKRDGAQVFEVDGAVFGA